MTSAALATPHAPLRAGETLELSEHTSDALVPAALQELPTTTRLGRFALREQLGVGGMGVVFAAHDRLLDRPIAIKLLHGRPGANPRVWREARALARVSHPNVVQIFEIGEHDGRLFMAMEFVAGPSLARWLGAADRSPARILDVFHQAGQGLAAAHAAGLVHCDFKPANVMLGADGRVRLVDFGLARRSCEVHDPTAPDVATRSGTPRYSSPEQRRGEPLTARSDQYSFSVALHEALASAAPGPAMLRIREVLARGLAESPTDRFPDMHTLGDALLRASTPRRRRWALARPPGRAPACEGPRR